MSKFYSYNSKELHIGSVVVVISDACHKLLDNNIDAMQFMTVLNLQEELADHRKLALVGYFHNLTREWCQTTLPTEALVSVDAFNVGTDFA